MTVGSCSQSAQILNSMKTIQGSQDREAQVTDFRGIARLPQVPSTSHTDHPHQHAHNTDGPSGIIPFMDADAECPGWAKGLSRIPGGGEAGIGPQRHPSVCLQPPVSGAGSEEGKPLPFAFLVHDPQVGWSRAPCAEQGGCSESSQRTFLLCRKNRFLRLTTL